MTRHLKSDEIVDASWGAYEYVGEKLGGEMAARNPAPGVPSPTPEEAQYGALVNKGTRQLADARAEDIAALTGDVDAGASAREDRDSGRDTPVPSSWPWPPGLLIGLVALAIALALGIDAVVMERPWRDVAHLPDTGDWLRRFLPPMVIATSMALFAYLSALGADRAAEARSTRARHRGWWMILVGAALLAVPVLGAAAIRTRGEANRVVSTGGILRPEDGITFLALQCMLAGTTLGLSHLRHYLIRRRKRQRHDLHQSQVISVGQQAQSDLVTFQDSEDRQRDRLVEAAANGFIVLRRTVETEMVDQKGAAGWAERNRRDLGNLSAASDGRPALPSVLFGPPDGGQRSDEALEEPAMEDDQQAGRERRGPGQQDADADQADVEAEPPDAGQDENADTSWDDLINPHGDDEAA